MATAVPGPEATTTRFYMPSAPAPPGAAVARPVGAEGAAPMMGGGWSRNRLWRALALGLLLLPLLVATVLLWIATFSRVWATGAWFDGAGHRIGRVHVGRFGTHYISHSPFVHNVNVPNQGGLARGGAAVFALTLPAVIAATIALVLLLMRMLGLLPKRYGGSLLPAMLLLFAGLNTLAAAIVWSATSSVPNSNRQNILNYGYGFWFDVVATILLLPIALALLLGSLISAWKKHHEAKTMLGSGAAYDVVD